MVSARVPILEARRKLAEFPLPHRVFCLKYPGKLVNLEPRKFTLPKLNRLND